MKKYLTILLAPLFIISLNVKATDLICEGVTREDSKTLKLILAINNANTPQVKLNAALTTLITYQNDSTHMNMIPLASLGTESKKVISIPQNIAEYAGKNGIVQLPINAYNLSPNIPSELTAINHVDCVVF